MPRYLRGTKDKGMDLNPTGSYNVDCYIDADFAGLWEVENDQDSLYVKSRTGFSIRLWGVLYHGFLNFKLK